MSVDQPIDRPKVFLNYAREDVEQIEELYEELVAAGTHPWMDTQDLVAGEDWKLAIARAIRAADFFIVCISSRSVNKRGFVQREIKHGLELWTQRLEEDIYLIPVRLDECEVPSSLERFQWVDLFEEQGFRRLLKAIRVGSERMAPAATRDPHRVQRTDERSAYPLAPKFFYYISTSKVEMLLPQVLSQALRTGVDEPLVTKTLKLVRGLERNNLAVPLEQASELSASRFYSSTSVWRNGLFYFRTLVSVTVAYFLWKKHGDALIILAGSPDNLIGGRVVAQGVEISSTGDAIDSIGTMRILEAMHTDEEPSVVAGRPRSSRIPAARKRLSLQAEEQSGSQEWMRDRIYTQSPERALAIFCLDHLAALPEMMMETLFRVYSKSSAVSGSVLDDLRAEYEKGRQEYAILYTDEALDEGRRLGLADVRTIYIGSPVYTAIG